MGYNDRKTYGVLCIGYDDKIPTNRIRKAENVCGFGVYGLCEVWIT